MPRMLERQGHGGLFSISPHMEHNVQKFKGDNLVLGRGSMTELTTSKLSTPSSKPLGSIKLPSIRSLIEDVSISDLNGLPHSRPERFPVAISPPESQTSIPGILPNVPSASTILNRHPQAERGALWNNDPRSNYQTQSLSIRPGTHQNITREMPLIKPGHAKRSGIAAHSRHLSSGQLAGDSFVSNGLGIHTIIPSAQLPLPLLNEPSNLRRTSCTQANELPAQQYHQHHISPKALSMNAEQQAEKYVCQQCNKVFSRPSSLKIHGHSHTGEKPFRCPHADCGKTFSVRSNMKRHEKGCHEA